MNFVSYPGYDPGAVCCGALRQPPVLMPTGFKKNCGGDWIGQFARGQIAIPAE
jgi:hypothetical protein